METHLKNSSQKQTSSSTSSPSHDFSFSISLQPLSSKLTNSTLRNTSKTSSSSSSYQQTNPHAVDLSPADDIFFHGHLLPLQILSHLPVSPRKSTGSYNDGFALPLKDVLPNNGNTITKEPKNSVKTERLENENQVKTKPVKPFSLFSLSKWRKGFDGNEQQQQQKKKLMSLDLSHAVKKYIRMLFQRTENGTKFRNRRQTSSYSFSSSLMAPKGNNSTKTRRCELFSAPASMRTSPTNSGHLRVSTAGLSSSSPSTSSSSSDSTMEELQAAIQAAIAHCKNSSAVDRNDKVKD